MQTIDGAASRLPRLPFGADDVVSMAAERLAAVERHKDTGETEGRDRSRKKSRERDKKQETGRVCMTMSQRTQLCDLVRRSGTDCPRYKIL